MSGGGIAVSVAAGKEAEWSVGETGTRLRTKTVSSSGGLLCCSALRCSLGVPLCCSSVEVAIMHKFTFF